MTLTTESLNVGQQKATEKPQIHDPDKPVLPEETPARITVIQKYKRGPEGKPVPLDHVYVTFNHIGRGRGGRFKVPRSWFETLWKSLQK